MNKYDTIVIGGGPAGMIAAGRAGELGSSVLLLEKNKELGVKLLITGNGRCNFSNNKNDREFIEHIGTNGKFLFSSLHQFNVEDIKNFFINGGVNFKTEEHDKIFPISNNSKDIKNVLIDYLKESKVEIKTGQEVISIIKKDNKIEKIILSDNTELKAKKYIITTGGKSFPNTGSTGDGYSWAEELGHTIIPLNPALTPIILNNPIKELQGTSIGKTNVSVFENDKKITSETGDIIFTDNGIGGPAIMNLSRKISRINIANITLKLDLFPNIDHIELSQKIKKIIEDNKNKTIKNSLTNLISSKLTFFLLNKTNINQNKQNNSITKEERTKLIKTLKNIELSVNSLMDFDRAYITTGGIKLSEIDPSTMKSKIIDNLYFAGEILDIDGPTGGYNLQICWSTGYTAGASSCE